MDLIILSKISTFMTKTIINILISLTPTIRFLLILPYIITIPMTIPIFFQKFNKYIQIDGSIIISLLAHIIVFVLVLWVGAVVVVGA